METPRCEPFLLEIGSEEIPARFLGAAEQSLGERLQGALRNLRLLPSDTTIIKTFSTPRRLVAWVPEILFRQPDETVEVLGPPVKVAFDEQGQPTRAAESFAQKSGFAIGRMVQIETPKGLYLGVRKSVRGRSARELLTESLPEIVLGISFPKTMYWTSKTGPRFTRPIRWLMAFVGEGARSHIIPFEIAGVVARNYTYGQRVAGTARIRTHSFTEFSSSLRAHQVELDPQIRRERIRKEIQALLEPQRLKIVSDLELEDWVVNSTEWPRAILGSFDNRFRSLPREILVTVMRDHQKYFAVEDDQGNLEPKFVAIMNLDSDPMGLIRQGHEKVLRARFADADFFWKADQKRPLQERLGMLERVTYQAQLGSYADKVRRMQVIAEEICSQLEGQGKLASGERDYALRAVRLSKCDLTTQMVGEFPELQGVVGGLYARVQGEPAEVADAIYNHYKPLNVGGDCPRSTVGAVVSLADKLDSVVAGFRAGLQPTGSSDPFGLRRAGNGIIKLAVEVLAGLDLTILMSRSQPAQSASRGENAAVSAQPELSESVDDFLRERMEFYFRASAGLRYDTVRAVLRPTKRLPHLVPADALSRAKALERIRDSEDFLALAAAAKRTRNIWKSTRETDIVDGWPDPARFAEEPERELYAAYQSLGQRIEQLSDSGNFEEAFRVMATMRPYVDRFFDKVLVMTEDPEVRRNRLMLLLRLNEDVFTSLADLAEIAVERPRTQSV